jgi:HPt (histidine-containing phosphotransfer) domain-containing protein
MGNEHMMILRWNREFALEQAADDVELLTELLDIFKTSFASDLRLIQSGIAAADPAQISGAAHSIKGASSSLGIEGITEVAKRIEDDSKSGSLEQARLLLPQLEQMLAEVEKL